jgi:hypothetical protein
MPRRAAGVSRARQAERPRFDGTASSVVCPEQADATASGGGGGGGGGDGGGGGGGGVAPCSTLRCDPETHGAMPRAGLRRRAFAVRRVGLLLSCNNQKSRPKKLPIKPARLGPPQANKKPPQALKRAAGGRKF